MKKTWNRRSRGTHDPLPFCFPKSSVTSRYVGPRKAETPYDVPVPRGGGICRYKQELVVGNVSKWLEEEGEREGVATHKWMLYVRGGKSNPDLSAVVSRVEVRLQIPHKIVFYEISLFCPGGAAPLLLSTSPG